MTKGVRFYKSLQIKIPLFTVFMTTVILTIFGIFEFENTKRNIYLQQSIVIGEITDKLEIILRGALWNYNKQTALDIIEREMTNPFIAGIRVFDKLMNNEFISSWRNSDEIMNPSKYLCSEKSIIYEGKEIGGLELYLILAHWESALRENYVIIFLRIIILDIVIAFSLIFLIKFLLLNRISALEEVMNHSGENLVVERIDSAEEDEIGSMTRAFYEMADRLYGSLNAFALSEERYKRLFENAEVSIWNEDLSEVYKELVKLRESGVKDLRSYLSLNKEKAWEFSALVKVVHVNQATLELFEAEEEDTLLYKIDNTFGPDAISVFVDELCAVWEGKKLFRSEASFRTLSGREIRALISLQIPDKEEGFFSVPVSIIDITDRKKNELELIRLQHYLSNIIDSMPSILVGVDDMGKVTQWNKTAEKATGINSENALGEKIVEIFPRIEGFYDKITESIQFKKVIQLQKTFYQTDNGIRFEDITIFPLESNRFKGVVIRLDDVTEKVRMETIMIQSEKMISVGGLAAGMAHEINNPLAGLMQTAMVMENRLGNDSSIQANLTAAEEAGISMTGIKKFMEARGIPRMIKTMLHSGRRIASIVENMLTFARKSEAKPSLYDMTEIINQTLDLAATDYDLKKKYDFKLIRIEKKYEPELPEVVCEKGKIQQALLNILRNGAQAMQASGSPSPCFVIRTRLEKKKKFIIIEIEDNGTGMEEEVRKRIFEPFFTTNSQNGGIGLGLSVAYFIITETHRGELSVESHPGSGSRFIIRLPVEQVKEQYGI